MTRIFECLKRADREGQHPLGDLDASGAPEQNAPEVLSVLLPDTSPQALAAEQRRCIPVETAVITPEARLVFHTDPDSSAADRFRLLRMRLREFWAAGKLRTVLVTSALPRDGKSTVAMNLATALAEGGKRSVLLIDADLYQSSVARQLRVNTPYGLADCLDKGLNPMAGMRLVEPLGWYLLSAGQPRTNATELLQTQALVPLLQRLSSTFDWVIMDTPPVLPVSDAAYLSQHTDGTLLVSRAGHTPKHAVQRALDLVGRSKVVGIVLNGVHKLPGWTRSDHRYYSTSPAGKSPPER
jgi:capsular exopolysaccharide synthesis family protein